MKNILIVSNNDMCRSRMAQEILNSFGRGMKISTAGILAGNSRNIGKRFYGLMFLGG